MTTNLPISIKDGVVRLKRPAPAGSSVRFERAFQVIGFDGNEEWAWATVTITRDRAKLLPWLAFKAKAFMRGL